jgi:hypothetical protein
MRLRDELERIDVPDAAAAEERARAVLRRAFEAREPVPRRRGHVRPLIAVAVCAAVVAAALSSPGRAVLGDLRDQVVGEKNAAPALFALPSPGRLVVQSALGPWVVNRDGSKRLLDDYDELSWSPHGVYVVGTSPNELTTLEPNGSVHWSIARKRYVSRARWSPAVGGDTRIAYFSGDDLRVVAGDGRGDRVLTRDAALVAPAWYPLAGPHLLAFSDRRGGIHLVDVDRPAPLRRATPGEVPTRIEWTGDGSRLLVLGERTLRVLTPARRLLRTLQLHSGPHALAVEAKGKRFAVTQRAGNEASELIVYDARLRRHRLFAGTGDFTGAAWSPDRRWILLAWPTADQWLFVPPSSARNVRAVTRIAEQFSSEARPAFPTLGGWCCVSP